MATLEERIAKLEAQAHYQDRQIKRLTDVIKSAGGQLASIPANATLTDVINAVKSAAGQLLGASKP